MDRIAALQQFIEQSPDDPFPRYGLALEYKNAGDTGAALSVFAELVSRCPDYVATYLMYGDTLAASGDRGAAASTYRIGIEVANAAGDAHAASELSSALAALGDSD